jgi:hypothetical protein
MTQRLRITLGWFPVICALVVAARAAAQFPKSPKISQFGGIVSTVSTTAPSTNPTTQPAGGDSFALILPAGVAPCTVHVHALNIPLTHGTQLTARYQWDFGDPGGKFNQLAGWNAAHVYDRAGRYTIALALTDEAGDRRAFTKTISIAPDDRRKIFVASNGNDSNNGADSAHAVRTMVRAAKLIGRDSRILLHCGDTFDVTEAIGISQPNVVISSYDESLTTAPTTRPSPALAPPTSQSIASDRRPVIRYAGPRKYAAMIRIDKSASDFTIEGITFDSVFNKDTEMSNMPDAIKPAGVNATIRNCRFLNVGDGMNLNSKPRGVLMQDCDAPLDTGIRAYLAWCEGSDIVFLGNYAINSTRAHTIRVGGADRLLIAHNSLSNISRRAQGDQLDWNNGALTIHEGSCVYVTDNIVNSGLVLLGPLGGGDGLRDISRRWHWGVIERNRINSWVQVVHGTDHVMIRNNVIRRNDWSCVEVEGYNETYKRGCSDVTIANNTGVNAGAKGFFLRVTGAVDGVTLANNLYVAPKIPGGKSDAAAVWVNQKDLSSFQSIAHNIWPLCKNGLVNFVNGAGVSPDAWLQMPPVSDDRFESISLNNRDEPTSGTSAIRDGMPVPGVWDDLNGQPRPTGSVIGAIQETR